MFPNPLACKVGPRLRPTNMDCCSVHKEFVNLTLTTVGIVIMYIKIRPIGS